MVIVLDLKLCRNWLEKKMKKRLREILPTGCVIAGLIAMTGLIAIGQEQPAARGTHLECRAITSRWMASRSRSSPGKCTMLAFRARIGGSG